MNALPPSLIDAAERLDRRAFLRLIGGACALGLVPASCHAFPDAFHLPPGAGLRILSPRSYATLIAAGMRIVGPEGAEQIRSGRVEIGRTTDHWLARAPGVGKRIHQALLFLEFGVWPFVGKLRPFTSLPGRDQDTVLEELMRSRFRLKQEIFRGIKSFVVLAYHFGEATWPDVGYPGPFGNDAVNVTHAMKPLEPS